MNNAHLHLIINHIPVVGFPILSSLLGYGLVRKQHDVIRAALFGLIVLSALSIVVYLSGEPAEKVIEHLSGFSEDLIEPHENAAAIALILIGVTTISAVITLVRSAKGNFIKAALATLIIAVVASGALGLTAFFGGKIIHVEIRENIP